MQTAKLLYRRLDSVLGAVRTRKSPAKMLEALFEDVFANLHGDLGFVAGLFYAERDGALVLARVAGVGQPGVAESLALSSAPVAAVAHHRVYLFPAPLSEEVSSELALPPSVSIAALAVGEQPHLFVWLFVLADGWQRDEVDFALNTVRAAVEARLIEARARGSMREAAEIQQSLLVARPPAFSGFDVACRSVAAEEVGGDFYDFYEFGGDILGLAIGDASGHGLPAALLVRDVVTGLRIGLERELKATYVLEKLNRVVHRSRMSSRFVSVFYAELESSGALIYVNAGHPPPLLVRCPRPDVPGGAAADLGVGGTVIGPLPNVTFRRGLARLHPGDVLVLCTDGILERANDADEFFGATGVEAVVRAHASDGAQAILDAIFRACLAHSGGRAWADDATVVVVKRQAAFTDDGRAETRRR
jgi:sigma-B regulation protein RsbU (phosphoserine phosphatase)